jgi:hypothetical protein
MGGQLKSRAAPGDGDGRIAKSIMPNGADGTAWHLVAIGNFADNANNPLWINNSGAVDLREIGAHHDVIMNTPPGNAPQLYDSAGPAVPGTGSASPAAVFAGTKGPPLLYDDSSAATPALKLTAMGSSPPRRAGIHLSWLRLLTRIARQVSGWVAAIVPATILFGCADNLKLPLSSAGTASGRQQCMVASNGAADCGAAVQALCRANGFESGASLDTQSELCFDRSRGTSTCVFVKRAACR